jgi:RimJ/RimL family protein N-acetyltransferase
MSNDRGASPEIWFTPRLRARRPRPDVAPAIFHGWAQDAEVTRYLAWCPQRHVDQTRQFLAACDEAWRESTRRPWVISRSEEDTPTGMIELRIDGHQASLGYVLSRAAWRHGYMTEAVQTLTQMALHELAVARVWAECDVENVASARLLERSGLMREGRLRRAIMCPNLGTEPRDAYLYARTRPLQASMGAGEVLRVLRTAAGQGAPVWVAGGWGIDALLGEQTRQHTDLDLAFRADDEPKLLDALSQLGYRVVLDYRPARLALADDHGHEIDLHPVRFDADGSGVQAGFDGDVFRYPPDAFTVGSIRRQQACLTAEQQLRFHRGYEPRDHDRQDVARLQAAFGLA